MSDLVWSLGGFVVGGGAVIIYAKATGQRIEWRRKLLLRTVAHAFGGSQTRPSSHS